MPKGYATLAHAALPRILLTFCVVLLFVTALAFGWRATFIHQELASKLAGSLRVQQSALELKYRIADLNGWQTAYALEVVRAPRKAEHIDEVESRVAFSRAATAFSTGIRELKQLDLPSDEIGHLIAVERLFARFMELDEKIVRSYASGLPNEAEYATDLVLGEEILDFQRMAAAIDDLVRARTARTSAHLVESQEAAESARAWMFWAGVTAAMASLILLVQLIHSHQANARLLVQLGKLAQTDPLTGIDNRRRWEERATEELERSTRLDYPLSLVVIDLDHFKAYNDTRGHAEGDRLLRHWAAAWKKTLRLNDILARMGGEEFALMLPDCTVEGAVRMVNRLRESSHNGQTFSAGIAERQPGESLETMYARADAALYRAKANGRNRIEPAPSLETTAETPPAARRSHSALC